MFLEKELALIVGIDIGASTIKGVLWDGSKITDSCIVQVTDAETSTSSIVRRFVAKIRDNHRSSIEGISVSGGGARRIGEAILGLPVRKVDEIKAIGIGGLLLSGKHEGLIVSMGTGTAIVAAYEDGRRTIHVGGTGVGGGTILGLSKRMLGVNDFKTLEKMASKGDTNKVDLTVADIVGGSVGIIPAEATASNFGRLNNEASKDDIAAGIFNMVSQTVGVLAVMATKAYGLEKDAIFVGRPVKSKIISKILLGTTELFGVKAAITENCEYCTAVGAAGSF